MLSVGREINIKRKRLMCRKCSWQGIGSELPTGLIRIGGSDIYLYAYCCPRCDSFEVTARGKILAFRGSSTSIAHAVDGLNADHEASEHKRTLKRHGNSNSAK